MTGRPCFFAARPTECGGPTTTKSLTAGVLYPALLVSMAVMAGAMLAYFASRGWFK